IWPRIIRFEQSICLSMSLIRPGRASAASSQGDGKAGLSSCDAVEDLRLRIPQSGAIEPTPGERMPAQHRVGLADRPPDAGLQDDSRLPEEQWQGHPQGLP